MERAVAAAQRFTPGTSASTVAVAISEWILARAAMAGGRVRSDTTFDYKDARLRGFIEAALPAIAGTLSHLPPDLPFFELPKELVIDAFAAGIEGAREAAVAAGESLQFPFSDEIPF